MLVHGHWDYRRLCKVIIYSFYKNVALTFILFYYCFFTGFSGQSLYESLVYSGEVHWPDSATCSKHLCQGIRVAS